MQESTFEGSTGLGDDHGGVAGTTSGAVPGDGWESGAPGSETNSTSTSSDTSSSTSVGQRDDCSPNPCNNGGRCHADDDGPACECPAEYTGDFCENRTLGPGDIGPCQNGGVCSVVDGAAECLCAPGWEGPTCETSVDDCAPNPCQNGGICTDAAQGFECSCPGGFEGDTCASNIDDCAPNPCADGLLCVDGIESFVCPCTAGPDGEPAPLLVSYTNLGSFTSGQLYDELPGITVTGSTMINVLNLNGLGVVGGTSDSILDTNEWLDFRFDMPSAVTSYFVPIAGNVDLDGLLGESWVQAWDDSGASLGTVPASGSGSFDLADMFGANVSISRFRVTADMDSIRIGSVTSTPAACFQAL
ncbi:MAG: hypothetical protein K0V04_36895 [Deltaproteobacteria bacterium]|nr:hypothetical protein [Deltaproteobacteria bacterium]